MQVVNFSPLLCAPIVGRMPFPRHSLTIVAKGTFDLSPDGVATPVDDPWFPTGDEYYPDDEEATGSCRYESDFAYFKPRADLLLVGRAHAPQGRAVPRLEVGFRVGGQERRLEVVGERRATLRKREPKPFTEMDLRYEYSLGGERYKPNPVGCGRRKQETESGERLRLLPNIEAPDGTQPDEPAGFGPLGRQWKSRASKQGTYKKKWQRERWPWFPEDFDWGHFNAAPTEMQVPGYLRGDEEIEFENLHPEHPSYRCRLPGWRTRCFLNVPAESSRDEPLLREVEMKLDTLWVDMEAEKLVLVWRGWTEVLTQDFEEVNHLLIANEALDEEPRELEHYRVRLLESQEEPESFRPVVPEVEPAEPDDTSEEEEAFRAALLGAGLDPDNLPQPTEEELAREARINEELGWDDEVEEELPWTRERVRDAAAEGRSFAGEDLKRLDLSELDLSGCDFSKARLIGTSFRAANLHGAVLDGANLGEADLSSAQLKGASLLGADLSKVNLEFADLTGASLAEAYFEKAVLRGALLCQVDGTDCSLRESDLCEARLEGGDFSGADFTRSKLDRAVFRGAKLVGASFAGVHGHRVDMIETDLRNLVASDGADFTNGSFQLADANDSMWEDAILVEADFSHAQLKGAILNSANLRRANFYAVDMRHARFMQADLSGARIVDANLFQGSLERALLEGADLSGSNLYGVDFLEAALGQTQLDGANLRMTSLA